jgi:hypothetical protein
VGQIGGPVLEFLGLTAAGCRADCKMRILVTETVLIFGAGYGTGQFTMFGQLFDTQLTSVRRAFAVSDTHGPAPLYAALPTSYSVQVLRYNPVQYAAQPMRWSHTMTFTKDLPSQTMLTQSFGTENGLGLAVQTYTDASGHLRVRFPFTVQ